MAAAVRVVANQQTGFRLIVVHRDGTDGITYNLLGDQIDIGRTEGDLLFEDPAPGAAPRAHRRQPERTRADAAGDAQRRLCPPPRPGRPAGRRLLADGQAGAALRARQPSREATSGRRSSTAWSCSARRCGPPGRRLRQITAAGRRRDIFHLTRAASSSLGREHGDIVFSDDEFLSRRHAQLSVPQRPRARWRTWAAPTAPLCGCAAQHGLASGDLIRMGDELLRFEIG